MYSIGDIDKGFDEAINFIKWSKLERSQLYGALAYLMKKYNIQDEVMTLDDFKKVGGKVWVQFLKGENDNELVIHTTEIGE